MGILLVTGLLLLVVLSNSWIIAGLLITIAGGIRIYDLRRGRLKVAPWPLTVVALIMPRPAAHAYLETLGHNINQVRGRERRRHVWHAVRAAPGTLVTVWHDWLRSTLVKLAVWALSRRVRQIQLGIQELDPRQYRAAVRRLRRYCQLILCATGSGQYHEYADSARALRLSCRQWIKNGGGQELDARIQQEVEKLAATLTSRRPDRA